MKKIYYTIALVIMLISACKKESNIGKEDEQEVAIGKVVVYHLKNGGQVTVVINKEGEYVVGGDVILSKNQVAYLEYNKIGDGKAVITESTFTNEFQKLWPGGIVYYTINDANNYSSIVSAINHWEANTPIRFVQRTNQGNYVNFSGQPSQGGGDSQLGMIGGVQAIRLVANAGVTVVIHEIGHAVGLMHEQTRMDRDQYINVNYSNINSNWTYQYDTYSVQGRSGSQIGSFDFNSVMLYRSDNADARKNGNTAPQMTKKDGVTTWGDNYSLSQGDIDGVNALYRTIYALITSEPGDIYQMDDWNEMYDTNHKIKFFSDPTFSTPMAIPRNLTIAVRYMQTNFPISEQSVTNNMYYDFVAPEGSSEINLWSMQTRIAYNGSMGMQAGSYYQGLSSVTINNAFAVMGYQ